MTTIFLTAVSMIAFAGNSLLCRLALKSGSIDPASFTTLRLVSGAVTLAVIVRARSAGSRAKGDWPSALALFMYAASFSYAYVGLPTGVGALLLFGAVQVTMIGFGLMRGERLRAAQSWGLAAACGGLVALLMPGAHAPDLRASLLMVVAGAAWGAYTLRGRLAGPALQVTAGNFLRAAAFGLILSAGLWSRAQLTGPGIGFAVMSGAVTSGIGYAIWYTVLPRIRATQASAVQLTVPVIAALGAVALLGESLTWRLAWTSIVVLGGVGLVIGTAARRRIDEP
ncbi:MAG: DMT family transporter [Caldimonas sp.]